MDEILEDEWIEEEEEEVITEFLRPTEVSVENLQFELDYAIVADTMTSSFSLEGLTLKPPSTEAFMDFLQYVSDEEPPEDFVLILEGGSTDSGSVVVNTKAISQESPAGHSIGSPEMKTLGGSAIGAVGAKILTASSGAGESASRGRVFQPQGYCGTAPAG